MSIELITTTIYRGSLTPSLDKLIASVEASARALAPRPVRLTLLIQNCPPDVFASLKGTLAPLVEAINWPSVISLSAARNIVLNHRRPESTFTEDTLVAYPDDDAWYPEGLLAGLAERFAGDPSLDFWFCRYGSEPKPLGSDKSAAVANARDVVRNASSNTLFMRGSLVAQLGRFDEALGLGTAAGGGEDIDYALRAFRAARRTEYLDAVLVGHRDKETGLRTKYYHGCLIALARHARGDGGTMSEYLRKIAVGAYLVGQRELSPKRFLDCNRAAARELLSRRS